jgi:hypothetical protein
VYDESDRPCATPSTAHARADTDPLLSDFCMSVVEDASAAEVATVLAEQRSVAAPMVSVADLGGAAMIVDLDGRTVLSRPIMTTLSIGRRVLTVARRTRGPVSRIVLHDDGEVATSLTAEYPGITHGTDPHRIDDLLIRLGIIPTDQDTTRPVAASSARMLDLIVSLTGIEVSREMLHDNLSSAVGSFAFPRTHVETVALETVALETDTATRELRLRRPPRPVAELLAFVEPEGSTWPDGRAEPGGACIAIVTEATVAEVVAILAPDVVHHDWEHARLSEETWRLDSDVIPMGIVAVDDAVILYEINGWRGAVPDVLAPLTIGRQAVGLHLNGRGGDAAFTWVADGALRAMVSSLPFEGMTGPDAAALLPLMSAVADCDPDGDLISDDPGSRVEQHVRHTSGIAVAEAITGIALDVETFLGARFTVAMMPAG